MVASDFEDVIRDGLGDGVEVLSSVRGVSKRDWRALVPVSEVRGKLRDLFLSSMPLLDEMIRSDNLHVRAKGLELCLKYGMGERVEIEVERREFIMAASIAVAKLAPGVKFDDLQVEITKALGDSV